MTDSETVDIEGIAPSVETIDMRIVLTAVGIGALINLSALLVPLFSRIGGGVVAGFVAACAVRRIVSGLVHAILASALVGGVAGMITALVGTILGLYNEPPLLAFGSLGPISPMLSGLGFPSVVLIALAFSLLTVVDGLVGGLLGGGLRALLPW